MGIKNYDIPKKFGGSCENDFFIESASYLIFFCSSPRRITQILYIHHGVGNKNNLWHYAGWFGFKNNKKRYFWQKSNRPNTRNNFHSTLLYHTQFWIGGRVPPGNLLTFYFHWIVWYLIFRKFYGYNFIKYFKQ